jgi:drug/metabolite transporter (DMT)-like permease
MVLFAALLHAVWNALVKSSGDQRTDVTRLAIASGVLVLPGLFIVPLPAAASWGCLAASAMIHVVYFSLVAQAYRTADMSVTYPLMRGAAPMATALVLAAFFNEPAGLPAWLGMLLVSAGIAVLVGARTIPAKAWLPALGNAVVIMCYTIVDGLGVRASGNALAYVLWLFALTALPMALLGFRMAFEWRVPAVTWTRSAMCGACAIAAYGLVLWAMTLAPIALVAALRETSILFGVIIAAVFLRERFGWRRWLAAALICVGAMLLKFH